MPDILNTLTANLVRFADGERPAASKFNAVNNYFSRSLKDIATVIGDVRDMSEIRSPAWNAFDTSNIGRPLDIVNIGRLIGPASNLNPKMQGGFKLIKETIPAGTIEFKLKYRVDVFIIWGIGIPNYELVNSAEAFSNSSQFKVINNSILFSKPTTEEVTVSYFTNPSSYHGGINYLEAGFNVIPDPNQETKLSVSSTGDNSYSVTLGTIQAQQSGIVDLTSSVLVDASEYNHNLDCRLPEWMIDKYSNADSKQIEIGEIYLKNITKSERYENATYTYVSGTQVDISGVALCTDDDYCLLICGTNITASIDDLRNKNFLHSHDGTFGESRINVKDLSGIFRNDPSYGPSSAFGDFPMYLHRDGYKEDSNANNGNNAMLGDLVLGLISFDAFNQRNVIESGSNLSGASRSILFGHPSIGIQRVANLLSIFSSLNIGIGAQGSLLLNSGALGSNILSTGKINIDSTLEVEVEAPVININSSNVDGVEESINILHDGKLNQAYKDAGLSSIAGGYTRLSSRVSSWLNKADIESTAYEYKIEITPSTDPDKVIPSCKDSFLASGAHREKAHFVTDVLVANVSKYDGATNRYEPVSGHQNVELVKAWENADWKLQRYRMGYLEPSLFIHYKKEISKTLTAEENTSYGLWNDQNNPQGVPPSRKVFEDLNNKAYFSITGENRVRYLSDELDLAFRRTADNSWIPSDLVSGINEYDITPLLKRYVNSFSLISDTGVTFPAIRMSWFNYSGDDTEYSLSELISRYVLVKIERTGKGISWLRTRQATENFPDAEVTISDSSDPQFVHLNINASIHHLLWEDNEIYDNFVEALINDEYTISVVRTFRDSGYSSLNADTVRKIAGTFRIGFAKDGVYHNSLAPVDGTGAEAALLNIYRNSSNVGNIGYSSVGNNRHKLIIARDNLPTSTSEFKTRKFRVLIEGGEGKGAYVFLKEDWNVNGDNVGYYNWREVVNLALRYPGETEGKKIEIYINGKKMGGRANVIEVGDYKYKDVFDLPIRSNILNITELIKIAYGEITKGYRFKSTSSLMSYGAEVMYPLGGDLDGTYLGESDVSNIDGNVFTYHHFDLDLECRETYNPFTGNVKLEINMSVITKQMGFGSTNTQYDA